MKMNVLSIKKIMIFKKGGIGEKYQNVEILKKDTGPQMLKMMTSIIHQLFSFIKLYQR